MCICVRIGVRSIVVGEEMILIHDGSWITALSSLRTLRLSLSVIRPTAATSPQSFVSRLCSVCRSRLWQSDRFLAPHSRCILMRLAPESSSAVSLSRPLLTHRPHASSSTRAAVLPAKEINQPCRLSPAPCIISGCESWLDLPGSSQFKGHSAAALGLPYSYVNGSSEASLLLTVSDGSCQVSVR
jgi:hypothetical protein